MTACGKLLEERNTLEEAMRRTSIRLACFGLMLAIPAQALAQQAETTEVIKLPLINSSDFDFISLVFGGVLKKGGTTSNSHQ